MEADAPIPIENLIAHRAWVRALAGALASGDAQADDLAQQAWVETLDRPPSHAGALRAWFATLLRRRARDAWRAEERRARREALQTRTPHAPSTASVVANADAHRRVVQAVMELSEPYRTTILLRFFQDEPPREIAARMAVPVETVRTRQRRALAQLRESLGRGTGGDAWLGVLGPLVGCRFDAGATGGLVGGVTMASKTTVIAAAGLVALAGVTGGVLTGSTLVGGGPPEFGSRLDALEVASATGAPSRAQSLRRSTEELSSTARDRRIDRLEARIDVRRREAAGPSSLRSATESQEERQLRRFRRLPTPALVACVRSLARPGGSQTLAEQKATCESALLACDVALARDLDVEQRLSVLNDKGVASFFIGDLETAETVHRTALDMAGASSEAGGSALKGLADVAFARRRYGEAAELFLQVTEVTGLPALNQALLRHRAGGTFESAGEPERARAVYRAIVEDFGGMNDAGVRRYVDLARASLEAVGTGGL